VSDGGTRTEIAGLPCKTEPNGMTAPLAAVAMVRGLDGSGQVRTWLLATDDVDAVTAIGMHEAAAWMWKRKLPG